MKTGILDDVDLGAGRYGPRVSLADGWNQISAKEQKEEKDRIQREKLLASADPDDPTSGLKPTPSEDTVISIAAAAPVDDIDEKDESKMDVESILKRWVKKYKLMKAQVEYSRPEVEEAMEAFDEETQKKEVAKIEEEIKKMDYFLTEKIGSGGFGSVYRGMIRKTGQVCAIKVIDLEETSDDIITISREIAALTQGKACPQLTNYYGSVVHGTKLWIAMEFLDGGSVLDLVKRKLLKEKHISIIVREVLLGLAYLQMEGKIHRDIKAANILLSTEGAVKLGDFGASRQLTDTVAKCNTFVGSPYWMAPEVMMQSQYDGKADIWSLGVTCLEMTTGKPPHAAIHPLKVMNMIVRNEPPMLEGEQWTKEFKNFVSMCLIKDASKRPPLHILLRHPFIKKAKKVKDLKEMWVKKAA
jgi:serine/threonine-protein kinase 24/25/MST4